MNLTVYTRSFEPSESLWEGLLCAGLSRKSSFEAAK